MASLLDRLLQLIEADAREHDANARLIFLGDLIDRGPDSMEAVELVAAALQENPSSRLILGNHDEFLLKMGQGLLSEEEFALWMMNGGRKTLNSYFGTAQIGATDLPLLSAAFRRRYAHHLRVFAGAASYVLSGNYCFVHAGILPNIPIEQQLSHSLRWIRDEFLDFTGSHGYIVVHGHTPTANCYPEVHPNRINMDTGAFATGRLAAAAIVECLAPRFIIAG